jgi:hypothetical protein
MSKSAAISAFVHGESQSPDRSRRPANDPIERRFTRRVKKTIVHVEVRGF